MPEKAEDPYARDKRRAAITVQSVTDEPVEVSVLRTTPYIRFRIADQIVVGQDYRARIKTGERRRLITVTDNRGHKHYLLQANNDPGGSDLTQILAWSRTAADVLTFHTAGYLPFAQTVPTGHSMGIHITFAKAEALKPGDTLVWQYALNETHAHIRHTGWHVLSDGVTIIPMQRPERNERALDMWPNYVLDLRKRFKTPETWRHMISMLRERFMEDLRPQHTLELVGAIADHVHGRKRSASPHRDRLSRIFCFNGKIAGLNGDPSSELQVEEGVAFGEEGHVAWIFRYRGNVVCVVVDKDEADSAAWVFDSAEAAAHLLHPRIQTDYRVRQRTLRQLAVRWCPHNGQWEVRLRLLVLALLRNAGYAPAESLYTTIAGKDDDTRRVSREVTTELRDWQARPTPVTTGGQ